MRLSDRVLRLPGSVVRGVFDHATLLEEKGRDVIHLEIGRPWHDTPAFIKDAAKAALDRGEVHYSPNRGIRALREEIALKLERENGILADPESEVLVTCGNKQATFLALHALVCEGEEVIVSDPHYGPHYKEALFVGAKPRLLRLYPKENWAIDEESLNSLVSPSTRVLVLNTPHNPTGRVLSHSELQMIANCAIRHDLTVITDETYEYFCYDGKEHISLASFDGMKNRTVSTFAFTKSYAMDGWRLGYLVGPEPAISAMTKLVQLDTAGPNTFSQFGAIEAVRSGAEGAEAMVESDSRARDLTLSRLREMGISCPGIEGTIYAFPRISHLGLSDEEFAERLLDERGVAVTPGSAFGEQGKGRIRIAFGAVDPERLEQALGHIQLFVKSIS